METFLLIWSETFFTHDVDTFQCCPSANSTQIHTQKKEIDFTQSSEDFVSSFFPVTF